MGKIRKENPPTYKSAPYTKRFWFHSENCYTSEELALREFILKTRSASRIHADYLVNPGTWFGENDNALVNLYDRAWLYSDAFKTRDTLNRDEFHVPPVDNQRLQWPDLYHLMQNVGDYLLIRNQILPTEQLNQPLNFFFLDLNNILKGLSQNPNSAQVKEQLDYLNQYIRTIETNISPIVGSDRLFLANFRKVVENEITPRLTHKIESQLLRDRLGGLSKTVAQVSDEWNTVLHFALSYEEVNPHSYSFSKPQIADTRSYPTQSAKNCGGRNTGNSVTSQPLPILHLTSEQLAHCPKFKLISNDPDVLNHYANSISDLNELERFQRVITQVIDLLGQAGEVYTIYQFKQQLVELLEKTNVFIEESSHHIAAIINTNTQAYYKALEEKQSLSVWEKLFTNKQEQLSKYISNQDNFAQSPVSTSDILTTNKVLTGQVREVITHLTHPQTEETSFAAIAEQAHSLNNLMGSMHGWIKIQHEAKGLGAPQPLELLILPSPPKNESAPSVTNQKTVKIGPFFAAEAAPLLPDTCPACPTDEFSPMTKDTSTDSRMVYMGMFVFIPFALVALFLIYRWGTSEQTGELCTKEAFDAEKTDLEDLLSEIQGDENFASLGEVEQEAMEQIIEEFKSLKRQAGKGVYQIDKLKELYKDLEFRLGAQLVVKH